MSNSNTPLQCDVRKAGVSNSPASLEEGDLSSCSSAAALVQGGEGDHLSLTKPGLAPHGQQGPGIRCNNGFSAGELPCILSQTTILRMILNVWLNVISSFSKAVALFLYLQNVKDHGHFSQV